MLSLDYVGHPFFDIGLAAIVAYAHKEQPTDLEEHDERLLTLSRNIILSNHSLRF